MKLKEHSYLINNITNDVYRKCNDGKSFALISPKTDYNIVILSDFNNCSPIKKQSAMEIVNKQFINFTERWKHKDKIFENLNCFGSNNVSFNVYDKLPEHKRNTKLVYHHGRIYLSIQKNDKLMLFDEDLQFKMYSDIRHCSPVKTIDGNLV